MSERGSVGADFPREVARVQEILGNYREIGPAGAFAAAWIEDLLGRALTAWQSQDTLEILRTYQELREVEG